MCKNYSVNLKNMAARGRGPIHSINFLKIFLLKTTGQNLIIFYRNNPYEVLFQVCSNHFKILRNMAARGVARFMYEQFKKSSQKLLIRIQYDFLEMTLRWHSPRFVKIISLTWKTWRQRGVARFIQWNLKKKLLLENHWSELNNIW